MKKCSNCQQTKDFSEFNKSKTGKFGFKNYCKECDKQIAKKYYNIPENNEKIRKNSQAWKIKNRVRYNEYMKKYNTSDNP